jgi:parallel beta-helix repeat protein
VIRIATAIILVVIASVTSMITTLLSAPAFSITCNYVASTSGSNANAGTLARPFRTVQHLADKLKAGRIGCVRGGTYRESVTVKHGGRSNAQRLTIESYKSERAILVGRLYVPKGSSFVTITKMNLNGRNRESLPSPSINSKFAEFTSDDVTNEHTAICFVLGSSYGRAKSTVIKGNRIHDCGVKPSRNEDHGIYVEESDNAQITNNVIFKNVDRGIQLFPDAQNTLIMHNIIDKNGEGILFAGGDTMTSNNTTAKFNLITNATLRYDVESHYPNGPGVNNLVEDNCVFGGAKGAISQTEGFAAAGLGNKEVDPEYVDVANGNYSVPSGNKCAAYVEGGTPVKPF